MSWHITCPWCGFEGDTDKDFNMNLTDECFCPACNECFEMGPAEDEDGEDFDA